MAAKLTRRRFFGVTAALALAAKWPPRLTNPTPQFVNPVAPVLWGDGRHDDTIALNAWGAGRPVVRPDGTPVGKVLRDLTCIITGAVTITRQDEGLALLYNRFVVLPSHSENFG